MKKYLFLTSLLLVGCGTTPEQVKLYSSNLSYNEKPSNNDVIKGATEAIRPSLKDPDSIKKVSVWDGRKCYEYANNMSGNAKPSYSYGYWCFKVSYYATNSYGAYVPGDAFIIYNNKKEFEKMNFMHQTITAADKSYVYRVDNPYMQPPGS